MKSSKDGAGKESRTKKREGSLGLSKRLHPLPGPEQASALAAEHRIRHKTKAEGVKSAVGQILWRSELTVRSDRPQRDHERTRQTPNGHDRVCNSKMPFSLQCYTRPDWDEKLGSHSIHDPRNDKEAEGPTLKGRVAHPRIRALEPPEAPRAEGAKSPERQSLEEKCPEEAELLQPPEVEITTDEKDKKDGSTKNLKDNKPPEKVTVNHSQPITIGGNLSAECRAELIRVLRKHVDAFVWVPADMTGIPRFVAEHKLKTYPHIELRVQRKRSIAPDRRKVVKEEVEE
ncbi:hypothetical protein Tco_1179660 [Tanacetum coccineum]